MKRSFQLTIRNLIKNKTFTIVASLGIMISTIFLTCFFIFVNSNESFINRQHQYMTSDYEISYSSDDQEKETIKILKNYSIIENIKIYEFKTAIDRNKVKINVKSYNKTPSQEYLVPIQIGTYPQNANEILVSKKYLDENGLDINSIIRLDFIDKNHDYKIVGTYFQFGGNESLDEYMLTYQPDFESTNYIGKIKLGNLSFTDLEIIQKKFENSLNHVGFLNTKTMLVNYGASGNDFQTLNNILLIIFIIISISIISNIFILSFKGKTLFIGMLRSIGATKKQVYSIFIIESLIFSFTIIPIGIMVGYTIMNFTLDFLSSFNIYNFAPFNFPLLLNIRNTLLVLSINFSIIMICNLFAIYSCNNYSILDLLKNNLDKKKQKKNIHKLIKKVTRKKVSKYF